MNEKKYMTMYLFTYASIGVLCPLIGQYLSSIGFSGTQIGTVTAVSTAISIFASTFWGKKYTNALDGRKIVFLLCVAAACMAVVNLYVTTFILFTITYGILYFFQGPIMGLTDAMVLETGENFAKIRLCGAIGYAASVFIGGKIGEAFGLDNIFVIYAGAFLIGGFLVMTVNPVKVRPAKTAEAVHDDHENVGFLELLKDKKTMQLILCGIFIFGSNVANNTYFGFLYRDGGGTVAGVGTIFLLMVGSEAPFMAIAPKLASKFTQEKLIAGAMMISVLRFGWYASGPSSTMLMVFFFLQGMVNGVLLVEYMKYISRSVEGRLIGIAVSAFYAISSSGGTILCNFLGGVAMDYYGSTGVYALFAGLNLIGITLYLFFGLQKTDRKQK
ncbi:PPP family 3-phenylpropionic acid transporter [Clostridiales Family XIII bacterium PM5-7]